MKQNNRRRAPLRRPAAVIFDMDGTLLDTETLFIKLWLKEDPSGDPRLLQCLTDVIGTTHAYTREHFRECFGPDYPYDLIRKKVDENLDLCRREGLIPLKPGAKEILEKLSENGFRLALASSSYRNVVEPEMKTAGLYDFFEQTVCGDEILNGKPAPDLFLEAAAHLGLSPEDCLAVEDSFNGIRSAHAAGMPVFMIPDIRQPDEEIRQLADRIFHDLMSACHYIFLGEDNGGNNG